MCPPSLAGAPRRPGMWRARSGRVGFLSGRASRRTGAGASVSAGDSGRAPVAGASVTAAGPRADRYGPSSFCFLFSSFLWRGGGFRQPLASHHMAAGRQAGRVQIHPINLTDNKPCEDETCEMLNAIVV